MSTSLRDQPSVKGTKRNRGVWAWETHGFAATANRGVRVVAAVRFRGVGSWSAAPHSAGPSDSAAPRRARS